VDAGCFIDGFGVVLEGGVTLALAGGGWRGMDGGGGGVGDILATTIDTFACILHAVLGRDRTIFIRPRFCIKKNIAAYRKIINPRVQQ
ncbi:hypothetical protein M9Y56_10790, partial [Pseudomonas juntendi]|uniref:hypothetical protein n=1 Tax=Pseudomonas juntendi TaxID=2666183 RepID=UPI002022E930